MDLRRLNPAVRRPWRVLLAGLVWSAVGLVLLRLAWTWIQAAREPLVPWLLALGTAGAVVAWRLGFSRIARRNLRRLRRGPDVACLFSFQAWRSWILVAVMVALGAALRHSPVPTTWLAPVYTTIGGGLLLASASYYADLWRTWQGDG